jgi:hypothetical protein
MYGLATKTPEIFAGLNAARTGPHTDAKGVKRKFARNLTLEQYLGQYFKDPNGKGLHAGHLFSELGIDENYTSATDLYQMGQGELVAEFVREGIRRGMGAAQREQLENIRKALTSFAITGEQSGGERWIAPEYFMDPVMRGAVQSVFYPDLVVREVMVPQPTAVIPMIELSDAGTAESSEGATSEVGVVNFGKKTVEITKEKKGIEITDEAILFNNVNLLSIFMEDLGRLIGSDLNDLAVVIIMDGDQADHSEEAAIIGVDDPNLGFQYVDITRVFVRLSLLGRSSTSIIGNEETAVDYLNLPEVKNKQFPGGALLPTNIKTPLPTDQDLYVSPAVTDDQLVFEDSSRTLVQLTARPLMVESDRDIKKGINGAYAQIWTGFANLQRNSRVIMDRTVQFNPVNGQAGGFPLWMTRAAGKNRKARAR